jgi:hypothetical protein
MLLALRYGFDVIAIDFDDQRIMEAENRWTHLQNRFKSVLQMRPTNSNTLTKEQPKRWGNVRFLHYYIGRGSGIAQRDSISRRGVEVGDVGDLDLDSLVLEILKEDTAFHPHLAKEDSNASWITIGHSKCY